jgi:cell division protein FtsN
MNTRLLRKIIGLILAALLVTSIVLLAGTTAAAQRRYHQRRHQRVVSLRSIDRSQPTREIQPIPPFSTHGPFGRPYHPFFDPYGSQDHYTFYRKSISRRGPKSN